MFRWKRSPDPKARLHELIGDYELPTFSGSALSTLSLLRENADLPAVAQQLMADPGLSVRVLRTANSAAFGLRQPASNLEYAVSLLGRSRVESLVLAAAVGDALPENADIDLAGFWRTAAQRACIAREIASTVRSSDPVEAFTAGLLQDMAVPVLATAHPDRYAALYLRSETDATVPLQRMEHDEFGYDHAQVGAMMAETWGLPEPLILAIADHHHLGERAPDAVEAVSLVRHCEPADDFGSLREHCSGHLSIDPAALDGMIEAAGRECSSLADSMLS